MHTAKQMEMKRIVYAMKDGHIIQMILQQDARISTNAIQCMVRAVGVV